MSRARFIVRGLVQGVNFRAAAAREAQRLGISGRIWNRDDGTVEADAAGDDAALASFEAWLEHGPRHASVTSVQREAVSGEPRERGFSIG
ncbi:MAG TPA: acylphosphatase [Candidatus Limnocylindria bacterium]|nr:acylphosphatase [Candidatus Limnocylindria bacterium]